MKNLTFFHDKFNKKKYHEQEKNILDIVSGNSYRRNRSRQVCPILGFYNRRGFFRLWFFNRVVGEDVL